MFRGRLSRCRNTRRPAISVAVAVLCVSAASAAERTTSQVLDHRAQMETHIGTYAIGDRLKITFFEQFASNGGSVLAHLIERTELSGEAQVQQDGDILVPLLGSVAAAGKSHAELQASLERKFAEDVGGHARVSIQLLEREPVYVVGSVAKPGTYKHVPGMTVLHLLALAGGIEGENSDLWRLLDVGRERERLAKASQRLILSLAKRDVFTAEREGRPAVPSSELVKRVGTTRAAQIVADEVRLRSLERLRLQGRLRALDALAEATQNEHRILQEKLQQVEVRIREKKTRAQNVTALRAKGTTTEAAFYLAQSEVSDALERWHETRAAIAGVERKLAELRQDRSRLEMDDVILREEALKAAVSAIKDEEVTTEIIGSLLAGMPQSRPSLDDHRLSFTVVRRTATGVEEIAAEEVEALQPGDLVRITPFRRQVT